MTALNVVPGSWVWIQDPALVWAYAEVLKCLDNGTISVSRLTDWIAKTRETAVVPAKAAIHLCNPEDLNEESYLTFQDLTHLNHLHEASVLHGLRCRYVKDIIYTYTGAVLIAINPYKQMEGLYSDQTLMKYTTYNAVKRKANPHIFAIAASAYEELCTQGTSRTILISGESGAGKTESTKYVMRFLATVGSTSDVTSDSTIEERVLQSNPLLEAFGNAKTLRNDNSSRFGKFIEMQFKLIPRKKYDQTFIGKLAGAKIETYLLETVRVCHRLEKERTFHSFYQLCAAVAAAASNQGKYHFPSVLTLAEAPHAQPITFDFSDFEPLANFNYLCLSGEEIHAGSIDDLKGFEATIYAMQISGISGEQQSQIWTLLEGILHMGNIAFESLPENADASRITPESRSAFHKAVKFLHLDPTQLEKALTSRFVQLKSDEYTKDLKLDECEKSRDALAKTLYSCLFSQLVHVSNEAIGYDKTTKLFCGILDIFGFECFPVNSFEQLCINFTNEKLQAFFNNYVFKCEEEVHMAEGIPWDACEYPDNQDCVQLLENRVNGIFAIVDEEGLVPQGTDQSLCNKLKTKFNGHPRFSYLKHKLELFTIHHFAGPVTYCITGFLEKNAGILSTDIQKCVLNSPSEFVANLFRTFLKCNTAQASKLEANLKPQQQRNNMSITISSEFVRQLQNLMVFIGDTAPYFIRCIKPNDLSKPNLLDHPSVVQQLRYGGVLEVLQVSRAGYPIRMPHKQALMLFKCLAPDAVLKQVEAAPDTQKALQILMEFLDKKFGISSVQQKTIPLYAVGKERLFMKFEANEVLSNSVLCLRSASALLLQAAWKMYVQRKRFLAIRSATIKLQALYRGHAARVLAETVRRDKAALRLQTYFRMHKAERSLLRLKLGLTLLHYQVRKALFVHSVLTRFRNANAVRLQAVLRGLIQRRKYLRNRSDIVRIQLWWKGVAAKKLLRALKLKQRDAEKLRDEVVQLRNELKTMNETHQETVEYLQQLRLTIEKMKQEHSKEVMSLKTGYEVKIDQQEKELVDLSKLETEATRKLGQITDRHVINTRYATIQTEASELHPPLQVATPSPAKVPVDVSTPAKVTKTKRVSTRAARETGAGEKPAKTTETTSQAPAPEAPPAQLKGPSQRAPGKTTSELRSPSKPAPKTRPKKAAVATREQSTGGGSSELSNIQAGQISTPITTASHKEATTIQDELSLFRSHVFKARFDSPIVRKACVYHQHTKHVEENLDILVLGYCASINTFLDPRPPHAPYTAVPVNVNCCPFLYECVIDLTETETKLNLGYIESHQPFEEISNKKHILMSQFSQCLNHWLNRYSTILIIYDQDDPTTSQHAYQLMRAVSNIVTPSKSLRCFCFESSSQLGRQTSIVAASAPPTQKKSNHMTLFQAIRHIVEEKSSNLPLIGLQSQTALTSLHSNIPLIKECQSASSGGYYSSYLRGIKKLDSASKDAKPPQILYPSLNDHEFAAAFGAPGEGTAVQSDTQPASGLQMIETVLAENSPVTNVTFGQEFVSRSFDLLATAHKNGVVLIFEISRTDHEKKAFDTFISNFIAGHKMLQAEDGSTGTRPSALQCHCIQRIAAHDNCLITQLLFYPNNDTRILTAALDKSIRVWDIPTGRMELVFHDISHCIALVFFASAPHFFLTSNANATMRFVDARLGDVIQRLQYPSPISALLVDASGSFCFAGSNLGHITVLVLKKKDSHFNLENKFNIHVAKASITGLSCITLSRNDETNDFSACIIATLMNGTIEILDFQASKGTPTKFTSRFRLEVPECIYQLKHCLASTLNYHVLCASDSKKIIAFTLPDLRRIASASSSDPEALAAELRASTYQQEFTNERTDVIAAIAVNASNTLCATGDVAGNVSFWRACARV